MKNYDTAAAVACLGEAFLDILKDGPKALSCLEREALRLGHMTIASAVALALEAHDLELCADLPEGARIRERRTRTLATTFGDLTFSRRVCVDRYGNTFVPLDEAVDLRRNSRVSPQAQEFLVDAASEGSYAKAAHFMEAAGGSAVSARTVMNAMRLAGEACEEADAALAHDLYANGVLPEADMARIRSRKYSGRAIPMPTRDSSLSPERRRARQGRVDSFFAARRRGLAETSGHGYDYPHKASTANMRADIRHHACLTGDHKVRES